jgi:2-dehydropantoate 2-reductase
LNPLKALVAEECTAVAKKDGVSFNIDFVKEINGAIMDSRNISSMQQDLMKEKKTEIEYLNLAVVGLGRKHGVKCPVNEALAAVINEMEK